MRGRRAFEAGMLRDLSDDLLPQAWFEAVAAALLLLSADGRCVLACNAAAGALLGGRDAPCRTSPPLALARVLGEEAATAVAAHLAGPAEAHGLFLPLVRTVGGPRTPIAVACRPLGSLWLATLEAHDRATGVEVDDGVFRRVVDAIPLGIDLFDRDFRAVFCNDYILKTLGYYAANTMPEFDEWFAYAYPDPIYRAEAEATWNAAVAAVRAGEPVVDQGEWWVRCEDGQTRRLRFILQPFGRYSLQITLDMTERYRADADLIQLALFDQLTGASTRVHFRAEAEKLMARARADGRPVTLMLLDVDHFKAVNDRHGHGGGDTVLREVVGRCRAVVGEGAIVARLGGDEFVLLLSPCDRRGGAAVADAVLAAVTGEAVGVGPLAVAVTASIGVFQGDPRGHTLDRMMELADRALYAAKHDGRARVRFAAA
jgi:diguanylate cyclase (GGDEF)-like protein